MHRFDFLVIGGGIAGLTYALKVADHGSVCVITKKSFDDTSTAWAQGGIAAVHTKDDSFERHVEDTLTVGAGLCNPKTVELVVREGPDRVQELEALGAKFDKVDGDFHLHQEGGHSRRRIFHHADATGFAIQKALLQATRNHQNIKFFDQCNAIDIITTKKLRLAHAGNRALGIYALVQNTRVEIFLARQILVATGGAGKVYLYTSNPDVASGDGIAMCYRAGVDVANMEFFQFHPTCLYHPQAKSFLITEAMRGEGAILRRENGERFMKRYHPDAELAPRDVVARAIDHEMKIHGEDYVLLDITAREPGFVREHFPTIYQRCLHFGFDITKQAIPVVPAAHYCCGGVVCDEWGRTSVENLFVAGECSHTGLHGANRLASNSLLEGVVFADRAARKSLEQIASVDFVDSVPAWDEGDAVPSDEQVVITQSWDEIRRFMWSFVGIVRSDKRLERALTRSQLIEKEIRDYYWSYKVTSDLLELRNLSLVAQLVIRCALKRKESRGLHYNIDHPDKQVNFERDTVISGSN